MHEIAGKRSESVDVDDNASVTELIRKLAELHGPKLNDYVFETNRKLKDGFAYAINGDSISQGDLSKFRCKDVTEFAILPPISGG
jgi:molybdopterin converting factor small subunit